MTLAQHVDLCDDDRIMHGPETSELIRELNQTGVEYLLTDAQVAHTLLYTAETTSVAENRARRIKEAQKAYESILHLLTKLTPDTEQKAELDKRLEALRRRLASFGEAPAERLARQDRTLL